MQQPGVNIAQASAGLLRTGLRIKRLSVSKRIPEQECIDRLNALDGRKFVRWVGEYAGTNKTRAVMVCDHGHEWDAVVSSLLSGKGCIKCAGVSKYSEHERIDHINSTGNVKFVRWVDGYKNSYSKAVVVCNKGHEFASTINGLVNGGKWCSICARNYSFTAEERISQINKLENIEFVCFDGEYKNCDSRAIVRCKIDNHEWSVNIDSLINGGRRCSVCSGKYVYTEMERIEQISNKVGVTFVEWLDGYKNQKSKAIMKCDNGHEWSASVRDLVNIDSGCPYCSEHGFKPSKPGDLYLLRSECGNFVKVGISNNHKQRIKQLKRSTPFYFDLVEIYHNDYGRIISDLESHFHKTYESAGFTGFDGATEWLKFSPKLLEEFRCLSR